MFYPGAVPYNLEFSLNTDLASYKKTVALLPFTLTIGEYVIPIQVSVEGEPEKTGESNNDEIMYTLNSNDVRIEQYRKLKRGKNSPKETHKKMDEISIHKYDVNKDVMVVHFDDKT